MRKGATNLIHRVYHKIVKSGNVTEVYSYENGVKVGEQMPAGHNVKKDNGEMTKEERQTRDKLNLERSLSRTIRNLRRSINANIGAWGNYFPKFMTLTFKQNIKDHATANGAFKRFIQRLNYHVTGEKRTVLKYTRSEEHTSELQSRGHLVCRLLLEKKKKKYNDKNANDSRIIRI